MNQALPNIAEPRRKNLSRREIAKILFSGLAAGWLPPGLTSVLASREHLLHDVFLHRADEALGAKAYSAAFLTPAQFASLVALTEAVIPGSRQAQSAEFIDLLLSVDDAKSQRQFVGALAATSAASQAMFQKEVAALRPEELTQLLGSESAKEADKSSAFGTLKSWTITAYYSSEIGLRELGWTPDRVFPSFPSCTHPESHS